MSLERFPNPVRKGAVKHKHFASKVLSENLFCFSETHENENKETTNLCTSLNVKI